MLNILPLIILQAWGLWPGFAAEHDDMLACLSPDGEGRNGEFEGLRRRDVVVDWPPTGTQEWQVPRPTEMQVDTLLNGWNEDSGSDGV